ncbi:MAG: histidine phosphatase family protein [Gammaproteobacteria bacterium]|nr:histidine phosphatase family protein [Gammaproteobacteria bacterium]
MTDTDDAPDPTTICVTRHGETDWNITGVLQGWIDVPLNDNGRKQALEMADVFRNAGFSQVWTSPLSRASETARIVAEVLGLPCPTHSDGLKERNFGRVQGMTKQDLSVLHPGLHADIMRRDPACHFDEGESLDQFADRIVAALHEIARRHPGERVLAMTHGWVMDVITRHVRQLPRTLVLDMKRKNGESLWLAVTAETVFSVAEGGEEVRASSGSGDRL